jgi:hypothetical protein
MPLSLVSVSEKNGASPYQPLKLTGAAILVVRGAKLLQAAPAA